ncbi:MAG TPA: hypothetical protein VFL15_07870 [Gammaproteobacteria bacterium]|nr:hypothetical protein [Gammaproteobacteria bacterium]
MAPTRRQPDPPLDDIPVLEDVVEPEAASSEPAPEAQVSAASGAKDSLPGVSSDATPPPAQSIPLEILSEVLTERITALTDRLLRDASAEIHATLVNKVWEKLREEIPGLVDEALRENGGDN